MAIKPSDIEKIIKIKFPNANVTIEAHGVEPESPTIERYSINFVCLDTPIEFKLGYNLVLLVDGRPIKASQHITLAVPKGITLGGNVHIRGELEEIEGWLGQISKYIQPGEVPKVQALARQHLGKELRVQEAKKMIIIYYDVFFIIVTPHSGSIYKNKGNKLIFFIEFDKRPIETFFRMSKDYANMIRTGQI